MSEFHFREQFLNLDEKNLPQGLWIEDNSIYTHHHVRAEDKVFYITCRGNHYFCKTPSLYSFFAEISLGFHNVESGAGYRFVFGYDRDLRTGYVLDFWLDNGQLSVTFAHMDKQILKSIEVVSGEYNGMEDRIRFSVSADGSMLTLTMDELSWQFILPQEYRAGLVGITFTGHIGELAVYDILLESDDMLPYTVLCPEKTVKLSLRNGGTMPYILKYALVQYGGLTYLKYSLDGGVQYRESYPDYPRYTDQYSAEYDQIFDPYIALYQEESGNLLKKIPLYNGDFTVTDPAIHWQVLRSYYNVLQLPLCGMSALETVPDISRTQIALGYEKRINNGFNMQVEEHMEFVYDFISGEFVNEGTAHGREYIRVKSEVSCMLRKIPQTVYEYESVIRHMENNHFFAETEKPSFTVSVVTDRDRAFLAVKAELQDVFGDSMDDMQEMICEDETAFTYESLPVGVYRVLFNAWYGDTVILTREIVFEICDPDGIRCAPLESGLPFLYSMPNEQKYLDRDAFDLYNPVPDCNMEHYYACSGMNGDIGMKKRIWETNRVFGRKWYVWDSPHRTMTKEEFERYGEDIVRFSDYCYYPAPTEWAVMRHDLTQTIAFNGTGLMRHLHSFLRENPQYNVIDLDETANTLSTSQLESFLAVALCPWMKYANQVIEEENREQTAWLRTVNPNIKRACYGPFPVYGGPITTHHSCLYVGSQPPCSLAEDTFDGFAQLEDYPYSCAYHTYQGACFVMHILLHNPKLCIYPEEYKASRGGCVDGAVKDAHPPIGKSDMPTYFNVTHAYEYVYNTAHLSSDGFRYWDSYGFMQRDFPEDFVDVFVRGWKHVVRHKPMRPLRSTAFLSEISSEEDLWTERSSEKWISNRSNAGLAYLYETFRLCGLPNGFAVTYDTILQLTSAMADSLVLPSLRFAPEKVLEKIRSLYGQGVSLIAVGDVTGLEDLFGVKPLEFEQDIKKLITPDQREERIFPDQAKFLYTPASINASVVLWAEGTDHVRYPAVLRGERTCLINASIDELGHRSYGNHQNFIAANISKLFREVLSEELRTLSAPVAYSDNSGITLLEDEHGDVLLLAIDYSDYDLAAENRTWESNIRFCTNEFTNIEPLYGEKPVCLRTDGIMKGISLKLHQQECALYKLIQK